MQVPTWLKPAIMGAIAGGIATMIVGFNYGGWYLGSSAETMAKAKSLEAEYERLNFRDDQFDMSDAFLSIAVALSAVAALVDSFVLLYIAWGSGAFGLLMGVAGFFGHSLRPEWIASLLGT